MIFTLTLVKKNEPEMKFTKRWSDYLEQHKESARKIDGEKIQFICHILLTGKTNEIVREIDQWIRQSQAKDGQRIAPETCPHRILFMEMMIEIPISSRGPKGGNALFLRDAERCAAFFGKSSSPGTS